MKSLILFSLLASLTACSSGSHQARFSLPSQPDTIFVSAYIDLPAKIACLVKLPLDELDSYRVGQRIVCSLAPGYDPNLLGTPVYVADVAGQVPVVVNSLDQAR